MEGWSLGEDFDRDGDRRVRRRRQLYHALHYVSPPGFLLRPSNRYG